MDVREMLVSAGLKSGDRVELSGWLVETNDGLYILGDHYPEDYNYPCRVRIENGNIIYPILEKVPNLGGGWSLIFHKAKISGLLESQFPWLVKAEDILVEGDRGSGYYFRVDISPELVASYVDRCGNFEFNRPRDPMRDWLDD
ncbi:hypothetical protein [Ralstonia solanacearum]|uniref:hypothetical protein n=1 Tax=Ralstonia solanacearum TaxID=305 RepID=UPI001E5B82F2|nr:hypothetical protein [Ralstonia solanacearum]MDC6238155.1 hypothetical protein [Ralstonia solanacearum]